ncbi:MAG: hypothetical protein ACREC0_13665 [Methylocella sp.]
MLDLLDSAANLHAALLSLEFPRGTSFFSTLAGIERLDPAVNAIVQRNAASAWRASTSSLRVSPASRPVHSKACRAASNHRLERRGPHGRRLRHDARNPRRVLPAPPTASP